MSRVLGWGANYAGEAIVPRLEEIEGGIPIKMDRWTACSEPLEEEDLICLQSLLCRCDKSFAADLALSSSSDGILQSTIGSDNEVEMQLFQPTQSPSSSAIPPDQSNDISKTSSPSGLSQRALAQSANQVPSPPSWMSQRRLRFQSASEIPYRHIDESYGESSHPTTSPKSSKSKKKSSRKAVLSSTDDVQSLDSSSDITSPLESPSESPSPQDDQQQEMPATSKKRSKKTISSSSMAPLNTNLATECPINRLITTSMSPESHIVEIPTARIQKRTKKLDSGSSSASTSTSQLPSPTGSAIDISYSTHSTPEERSEEQQPAAAIVEEGASVGSSSSLDGSDGGILDEKWSAVLHNFNPEVTEGYDSLNALEAQIDKEMEESLNLGNDGTTTTGKQRSKAQKHRTLATSDGAIRNKKRKTQKTKKKKNSKKASTAEDEVFGTTEEVENGLAGSFLGPIESDSGEPSPPSSSSSRVSMGGTPTTAPLKRYPDLQQVQSTSSLSSSSKSSAERKTVVMNNYFSIGVDSMVALEFHNKREASPGLFPHHVINKAWYGIYGIKHAMLNLSKKPDLRRIMRLELDGVEVELPKGVEAIVVLQIPSYSSGTNVWGDSSKSKGQRTPPTVCDGLFEVVGLKGVMHLGALQAGWSSGIRLGQASRAVFYNLSVVPVQCDGEPWLLPPCKTTIEFQNQSTMLFNILKTSSRRFKQLTGHPLPSMLQPAPETTEDAINANPQPSEAPAISAQNLRAHILANSSYRSKSFDDLPPRVISSRKAIRSPTNDLAISSEVSTSAANA
jgi:hypothetical protein